MLRRTELWITPMSVLTLDQYKRKQCCSAKPPRRLNVAESMQHQRNRAQKYEARIYTSGHQSQLNGVICVYAENSLYLLSSCLWGLRFGWMLPKGHWTLENLKKTFWTCQMNYFCLPGESHSPVSSLTPITLQKCASWPFWGQRWRQIQASF